MLLRGARQNATMALTCDLATRCDDEGPKQSCSLALYQPLERLLALVGGQLGLAVELEAVLLRSSAALT